VRVDLPSTVDAALRAVLRLDEEVVIPPDALLGVIAGWPDAWTQRDARASAYLRAFLHFVCAYPAPSVIGALREHLIADETLQALFTAGPLKWRQCCELYRALTFVHDQKIDRAILRALREEHLLHGRATWAAAFGVPLPASRRWAATAPRSRVAFFLLARVQKAGGRLDKLTLEELLILAQPTALDPQQSSVKLLSHDAHYCPGEKMRCSWHTDPAAHWLTPFAYFVHSCIHFAQVLTRAIGASHPRIGT
jgi:hypothetical protein